MPHVPTTTPLVTAPFGNPSSAGKPAMSKWRIQPTNPISVSRPPGNRIFGFNKQQQLAKTKRYKVHLGSNKSDYLILQVGNSDWNINLEHV